MDTSLVKTDGRIDSDERMILSDKVPILANPGTQLTDVYYNAINSTVQAVEVTYNLGRYTSTLNNPSFGATSQAVIPNSSLLGSTYLHLVLGASGDEAVKADQTLVRGWAYGAIREINYLFGSSNVSQLVIQKHTLLQLIMGASETSEKDTELFKGGGEEQLSPIQTVEANILLPFPWSTSSGLFAKYPFDTDMLQNPITIQVIFDTNDKIYGGDNKTRPTSFALAEIITRQGDFLDKKMSLSRELQLHPEMSYNYPFIHAQSFVPSPIMSNSDGHINATLLSFINADLLTVSLGCVKLTDVNPNGNDSPNPFNYVDITNMRMFFNGQVMYNSPGTLYKVQNSTDSQIGAGFFEGSIIQAGGNAPFTSDPVNTYPMYIDFSRIRSLTFEGRYQNVWRIPQNTITLEFDVPEPNTLYQLYFSYYYNGIVSVQRGQSRIYFN